MAMDPSTSSERLQERLLAIDTMHTLALTPVSNELATRVNALIQKHPELWQDETCTGALLTIVDKLVTEGCVTASPLVHQVCTHIIQSWVQQPIETLSHCFERYAVSSQLAQYILREVLEAEPVILLHNGTLLLSRDAVEKAQARTFWPFVEQLCKNNHLSSWKVQGNGPVLPALLLSIISTHAPNIPPRDFLSTEVVSVMCLDGQRILNRGMLRLILRTLDVELATHDMILVETAVEFVDTVYDWMLSRDLARLKEAAPDVLAIGSSSPRSTILTQSSPRMEAEDIDEVIELRERKEMREAERLVDLLLFGIEHAVPQLVEVISLLLEYKVRTESMWLEDKVHVWMEILHDIYEKQDDFLSLRDRLFDRLCSFFKTTGWQHASLAATWRARMDRRGWTCPPIRDALNQGISAGVEEFLQWESKTESAIQQCNALLHFAGSEQVVFKQLQLNSEQLKALVKGTLIREVRMGETVVPIIE